MGSINYDDGMHMIRHDDEPVNGDVCVMGRNHFHFSFSNDSHV